MMLSAYPQANSAGELQIWVGVFGADAPPGQPVLTINDVVAVPVRGGPPQVIRDGSTRNYKAVYAVKPAVAGPYRVQVQLGAEKCQFTTDLLPHELPANLDGSFNILLCSCYYQPRDDRGLLGDTVSQIRVQPHLTVMAGDQIYGDLPLRGLKLARGSQEIRADLGGKYLQNWASSALGTPGLARVLARAPVVCVPDDHEFWNNYPYRQAQIPDTLSADSFQAWEQAANELYQDYQVSEASATGAARFDVGPLKMLFLDLRTGRDNDYGKLMRQGARDAFTTWVDDLMNGDRSIGVLCSGQSLFMDKPNALAKHLEDAEMPNYKDFDTITTQLGRVADKGVPVVYITGDVHWGRIARAMDLPSRGTLLYEVISSPSSLIDSPTDAFTIWKHNTFSKGRSWPRHSDAADLPKQFGQGGRFLVEAIRPSIIGDQVAMISFARAGTGAEFTVTYYGISRDKSLSQSQSCGPFPLRPA